MRFSPCLARLAYPSHGCLRHPLVSIDFLGNKKHLNIWVFEIECAVNEWYYWNFRGGLISADPIQGGVKLSVEAWSGDGILHTFQWQEQQADGEWINIPGATKSTFEYTGLTPGEYTVRCIVKNAAGGETISDPITVTVS